MSVITFPAIAHDQAVDRPVPAVVRVLPVRREEDRPLHELLRRAVASYGEFSRREPRSVGARHHLAIAHTYLDAVAVIAGRPDVARELAQALDVDIHDIRVLARIARDHEGPSPA